MERISERLRREITNELNQLKKTETERKVSQLTEEIDTEIVQAIQKEVHTKPNHNFFDPLDIAREQDRLHKQRLKEQRLKEQRRRQDVLRRLGYQSFLTTYAGI